MRGCEEVGGLANHGVTDGPTITGHAGQVRTRGVATSTIGVGEDFDERLLGGMADAGGGHFFYVERDSQIPEAIATEVGEALDVTARSVTVVVSGASLVDAACVSGYPCAAVDGHAVRVSWRSEESSPCVVPLPAEVVFSVAPAAAVAEQPRNLRVDQAVAAAYSSVARREADRLARDGSRDEASRRLCGTADRIAGYADGDPLLLGLVAELREYEGAARFMAEGTLGKGRTFGGTSRKAWAASSRMAPSRS